VCGLSVHHTTPTPVVRRAWDLEHGVVGLFSLSLSTAPLLCFCLFLCVRVCCAVYPCSLWLRFSCSCVRCVPLDSIFLTTSSDDLNPISPPSTVWREPEYPQMKESKSCHFVATDWITMAGQDIANTRPRQREGIPMQGMGGQRSLQTQSSNSCCGTTQFSAHPGKTMTGSWGTQRSQRY
jgi:hypothetical protein